MNYIEIILAVNGLISFLLLKNCTILIGVKLKKKAYFFALLLDAIYMLAYLLFPLVISKFEYLFIIILSIIPFINLGKITAFKAMIIYLVENMMLGGISEIVYIASFFHWYYVLVIIIVIIIISFIYKETTKNHFNIDSICYEIKIIHNNQIFFLKGFCDTGNFLLDDAYIPIVFIDEKIKIGEKIKSINCLSVGGSKEITLYDVDKFYIKINNQFIKKNVHLAKSKLKYDVMFGISLLGG